MELLNRSGGGTVFGAGTVRGAAKPLGVHRPENAAGDSERDSTGAQDSGTAAAQALKLEAVKELIDEILRTDQQPPGKERHTAKCNRNLPDVGSRASCTLWAHSSGGYQVCLSVPAIPRCP